MSLLVQYTRVGVVFWTFNSLLMTWDAISTNDPLLVFAFVFLVISLGMLKEWISDSKRSKEDKRVNESKFKKIVSIERTELKSKSGPFGNNGAYKYSAGTVLC